MAAMSLAAEDGDGRPANRLIDEKSPYLLQHAYNPVDWYPWGEEAFAKARKENRPILLSVGYSTCHWCHVMERESFQSEKVAAFLNAHFVPVKLDREERPDVDGVYMKAYQAMSGEGGGWPHKKTGDQCIGRGVEGKKKVQTNVQHVSRLSLAPLVPQVLQVD